MMKLSNKEIIPVLWKYDLKTAQNTQFQTVLFFKFATVWHHKEGTSKFGDIEEPPTCFFKSVANEGLKGRGVKTGPV